MGIPIFEKKHFLQQSNDIPKHIEKADEGGDSLGFYQEMHEPFFSRGNRSQNIWGSSEGSGQCINLLPKIFHLSNQQHCMPKEEGWVL